jgi:hypothetical protein
MTALMNKVAELYKDPERRSLRLRRPGRDRRRRRGPGGGLVLVLGPRAERVTMAQAMRGGR